MRCGMDDCQRIVVMFCTADGFSSCSEDKESAYEDPLCAHVCQLSAVNSSS